MCLKIIAFNEHGMELYTYILENDRLHQGISRINNIAILEYLKNIHCVIIFIYSQTSAVRHSQSDIFAVRQELACNRCTSGIFCLANPTNSVSDIDTTFP